MRKTASLFLAAVLSLTMLAGCGNSSTPAPDTSDEQTSGGQTSGEASTDAASGSDEEVTLTFLHHMGEQGKQDGLVKLAEAFHEKYSNITVEVEFLSRDDFINQYKQRVSADNAPDIINYRPFETPELIEAGLIEPLDASMFPEGIDKNCINSLSIDGVIYGVPLDVGGYGFYYNKTQLEKEGIAPESLNTRSGVLDACEKLLAAGYTPLASGYAEQWPENIIIEGQTYTGILPNNPTLFTDLMSGEKSFSDYPEFLDIIEYGQKLVGTYALVDDKAASQQASDQYAQFGRGDAVLMMQGTWAISDIRIAQEAAGNTDEFGFTVYPWCDDEDSNYMPANADDSFMISKDGKHKEEAMLFAEFCLTEEASKIWCNASGCIGALNGTLPDGADPLMEYFTDTLANHAYFFEMNPGLAGQYYQDFDKVYIESRVEGASPEEVIERWQAAYDNIRATGG